MTEVVPIPGGNMDVGLLNCLSEIIQLVELWWEHWFDCGEAINAQLKFIE